MLTWFLLVAAVAVGQFDTTIDTPPALVGDNVSIGSNTQLNVLAGGQVGDHFRAGALGVVNSDIEVNIHGGIVGSSFHAFDGSRVTILGGTVGSSLSAYDGSVVTIEGGRIGDNAVAQWGSEVNIAGGTVGDGFTAFDQSRVIVRGGSVGARLSVLGGQLFITGGEIGDGLRVHSNSVVTVSGGVVGMDDDENLLPGSELYISGGILTSGIAAGAGTHSVISGGLVVGFRANPGSQVTVVGDEFRLDGVPIQRLTNVGDSLSQNIPTGALFAGVLADGTPFTFPSSFAAHRTLTIEKGVLPTIATGTITTSTDEIPLGIREGQSLVVDGDGVVPRFFVADRGSSVELQLGGLVDDWFTAMGANVAITGGTIERGFQALEGSEVQLIGGVIQRSSGIDGGSRVTVTGGSIGPLFSVSDGSHAIAIGGSIGEQFSVTDHSRIVVADGIFEGRLTIDGHSQATMTGGEVKEPLFARSSTILRS